jgi:type IV secretion system protein VirB4
LYPEILNAMADNPPFWRTLVGALATVAAGGGALAVVPLFATKILPAPRESRLVEYLPFQRIKEDGRTIECRDGTLFRCYELTGIDLASKSSQQQAAYRAARKEWLDRIIDNEVDIRSFVLREQVDPTTLGQPDNPVLARITKGQADSLGQLFKNRHFILISTRSTGNPDSRLDQAEDLAAAVLAEYGLKRLSVHGEHGGMSPLSLLARLASPLTRPQPRPPGTAEADQVNEVITSDTVHFDRGNITFSAGHDELHIAAVGLRRLADTTEDRFLAELSSIPAELCIFTAIRPMTRPKALLHLEHRKKLAPIGRLGDGSAEQLQEATSLVEGVNDDKQTLHSTSQTIFVLARNKDHLDHTLREINKIAAQHGVTPVREGMAAEAAWWNQFPTFEIYPRSYKLYSENIASLVTFERPSEGSYDSPWGPGPLCIFKTATGTPYGFNLHVRTDVTDPVAHAVVIGPTGGGKSTLFQFLAACAMRHPQVRCFLFDRFNGMEIFTNAANGSYVTFDGAEGSATMNPLQMQDTPENRTFLKLWIQNITNAAGEAPAAEISRAIDIAFDHLSREERSLEAIHKAGFGPRSPVRAELRRWINGGQYGALFSAPRDTIDLGTRLIGFDFTQVLDDPALGPAVVSYLMHRIRTTLTETGNAGFIFIDETEPLLRNEAFRNKVVKPALQEFRKLNSAVIICFQRPGAIDDLGMGDVVRGQCQSVFFLPNPQADERDYAGWNLSDEEWQFITGKRARHLQRAVLLKRVSTGESVILDTNLAALKQDLLLLSSSRKHVTQTRRLRRELGDQWIEHYVGNPE